MEPYFTPDRSKRPKPSQDTHWTHKEGCDEKPSSLCDGRPLITESAYIEGFFVRYYYFDSRNLVQASKQELRELLKQSGYEWPDHNEDGTVRTYSKLLLDAQGRSIWEIQAVFPTD